MRIFIQSTLVRPCFFPRSQEVTASEKALTNRYWPRWLLLSKQKDLLLLTPKKFDCTHKICKGDLTDSSFSKKKRFQCKFSSLLEDLYLQNFTYSQFYPVIIAFSISNVYGSFSFLVMSLVF